MAAVEHQICEAIRSTHSLRVRYHDKTRVLEPYLLGEYADKRTFLLAWMVRCEDDPHKPSGWQHYLVSEIHLLEVLDERFGGDRTGYNPVSDTRVRRIVCSVSALRIVSRNE